MASAGGLVPTSRAVSRTITATARALWPEPAVLGLARAASSRELGSMASTSIARRIGKRAMAHGAGSVGLYTTFTRAVPYAAVSNTQVRATHCCNPVPNLFGPQQRRAALYRRGASAAAWECHSLLQ